VSYSPFSLTLVLKTRATGKKGFGCLFCKYAEVTVAQYDWLIKFGCGVDHKVTD